jgi:hypothetical protein
MTTKVLIVNQGPRPVVVSNMGSRVVLAPDSPTEVWVHTEDQVLIGEQGLEEQRQDEARAEADRRRARGTDAVADMRPPHARTEAEDSIVRVNTLGQ